MQLIDRTTSSYLQTFDPLLEQQEQLSGKQQVR